MRNPKNETCMSNKIYSIGIQNFESLRNDGYFYIDKSLLISTLEVYFQGKRELFTYNSEGIYNPFSLLNTFDQKEVGLYRLGFPNKEVEEGFMKFLMPFYTRFSKVEAPFEMDSCRLFKIGVNFSSKTRNIEKWIVEE